MTHMSAAEYKRLAMKSRRSKYRAVRTKVDGISFHSKGEAKRWRELRLLAAMGEITGLQRQVRFPLFAGLNRKLLGHFVADFIYDEPRARIAEEYKGVWTPLAKWKIAHFSAEYPNYTVRITGAAKR